MLMDSDNLGTRVRVGVRVRVRVSKNMLGSVNVSRFRT